MVVSSHPRQMKNKKGLVCRHLLSLAAFLFLSSIVDWYLYLWSLSLVCISFSSTFNARLNQRSQVVWQVCPFLAYLLLILLSTAQLFDRIFRKDKSRWDTAFDRWKQVYYPRISPKYMSKFSFFPRNTGDRSKFYFISEPFMIIWNEKRSR